MNRDFIKHFRQHVIPRLKELARTQGFFLASDLIDFAEAHDTVWQVASRLGITRLRDEMIVDVRDWIDEQIWAAFEEASADLLEYRRTVSDPVARDIQQWERKLARHLRQKEGAVCQTTKAA
jgi:hypothetical protein